VCDLLTLFVIEHLELIFGEATDVPAAKVGHGDVDADEVGSHHYLFVVLILGED
jgi:hypothetical protein